MSTKKKSNYIGYELDWLEERCEELRNWVEEKLAGGITDRIEIYTQGRTPIIKVIASEETQIKTLRDTLKELPSMLMEINRLRKLVEEEQSNEKNVRGDHDIPGFMEDDDDDVETYDFTENENPKPKKKTKEKEVKKQPQLPAPSQVSFADDDDFEDYDNGDFEEP